MHTPTPELGHHMQRTAPTPRNNGDTRVLDAPLCDDLDSADFLREMGHTLSSDVLAERTAAPTGLRERSQPAHLPELDRAEHTGTGGIMLVGSSGGHLAQLLALEPWWALKGRHWVTFRTPDAESLLQEEQVTWAHYPTTRNVPNLLRNAMLAVRTLRQRRPDAIVSTGAGVALPFFMLGRLLGIPTVYIEVFDRIDSRTLTARLCGPFTSTLLVQWEEQRLLYPHATVVGTLL